MLRYYRQCFLLVSLLCLSATLYATEPPPSKPKTSGGNQSSWFYGVMAGYQTEAYDGVKNKTWLVPVVGYRSQRFSWIGPRLSYAFWTEDSLSMTASLRYRDLGYDADDSDSLAGMRNRSGSIFGGVDFKYKMDKIIMNAEWEHDLQSRSKGMHGQLAVSYDYKKGPIFFAPKLGLAIADSALNDYYFGVRASESRPQRSAYNPGTSYSPSVELTISTPIFFKGFTRLSLGYIKLDSEITDSPIVSDDSIYSATLSFTKPF